jgi:hypothetical protein
VKLDFMKLCCLMDLRPFYTMFHDAPNSDGDITNFLEWA